MTPDPVRVAARYKSKKKIETKDGDEATVYEYSEKQIANRNRDKAEKVEHLRKNISDLRARVKDDLTDSDPMTRMTALAVSLIDETCERVGNEGSAEDGHYGVTVWEAGHVSFKGDTAIIKYVGKSGVDHTKTVDDGPTVKALKELVKGRGKDEAVFDTDDAKVSADDVNDYLAEFDVTAKDIRGYRANDEMCKALRAERAKGPKDLPRASKEKDKILGAEFKRALETVAEIVGHTESILRSSYLVPGLEDAYTHDGTVLKSLKVGTKTDAQREDEATEKLVKPSPKAKPPRHDLRNERVEVEKDPDLDTTDDDLSRNFKKVASPVRIAMAVRVAARYLQAETDSAEDEFLKSVEDKLFKTPKSDKEDGVSYSHLKHIDPEMAKAERANFVPKGGKKDDEAGSDKDEAKGETKNPSKEKGDSTAPAPESLRKEITDSLKNVKVNLSTSTANSLDSLHTTVTKGMSEVDLKRLAEDATEQALEIVNTGAEALGEGKAIPRDTFKVPAGMYKLTSGGDEDEDEGEPQDFDSKKSNASIKSLVTKRDELAESLVESKEATKKATAARDAAKKSLPDLQETTSRKEKELAEAERGRGEVDKKLKGLEGSKDTAAVSALEKERRDLDARVGKSKDDLNHAKKEVEKADGSIEEHEESLGKLDKRMKKTTDALAEHNDALITATAYHTAMTHLTGLLSDPSKGSDDPHKRLSESAAMYAQMPKNIVVERKSRLSARQKEINEILKSSKPKDDGKLKKELATVKAEMAAARFSELTGDGAGDGDTDKKDEKDLSLGEKLVQKFTHLGVEHPHISQLLLNGTSGDEGGAAVQNLAHKLTNNDLCDLAGDDNGPCKALLDLPGGSQLQEIARRAIINRMLAGESGTGNTPKMLKSLDADAKALASKGKGNKAVESLVKWIRGPSKVPDQERVTDIVNDQPSKDTPQTPAEIKEEAEEFAKHIKDPVERAKVIKRLKKMSPDEMLAMMGAAMADDEGETPIRNKAASPLRVASRFLGSWHGVV